MFTERKSTKYKIQGEPVEIVFPSGYYVVRIKRQALMGNTINGLRKLAADYKRNNYSFKK
jgi:hypothetical protein